MEALLLSFQKSEGKTGTANSFTDQLSSKYSVAIFGLFALLASAGNYFHQPISCFCPKEWESSQVDYAEKFCWTEKTVFIPFEWSVFQRVKERVTYYQWISLILVGQAFLFYLPSSIWKIMSKKSGIAVSSITDAARQCRKTLDSDSNDVVIQFAGNIFNNYLHIQSKKAGEGRKKWRIFKGTYLTYLYICVKFLYSLNVIGQFFLLNGFLGNKYHLYGFDFMSGMASGKSWQTSERFPRVTFCNISIRVLANSHRHLLQCTLPMNLIYEMMFLVIWFWLVFVSTATCCSFLRWILFTVQSRRNLKYVTDLLVMSDVLDAYGDRQEEINEFVYSYLRKDGWFILKIIECNAGEWAASSISGVVWQKYQAKRRLAKKRISYEISDEGIDCGRNKYI